MECVKFLVIFSFSISKLPGTNLTDQKFTPFVLVYGERARHEHAPSYATFLWDGDGDDGAERPVRSSQFTFTFSVYCCKSLQNRRLVVPMLLSHTPLARVCTRYTGDCRLPLMKSNPGRKRNSFPPPTGSQTKCIMKILCLQKGLKNVFDEAILAALEPPEPVKKRRCILL